MVSSGTRTKVSDEEANKLSTMYFNGGDNGRGMSLHQISTATGRSTGAISRAIRNLGGQLRSPGRRGSRS